MRIDQVLVSAGPGDAITNFAMTLRGLFAPDVRSDIYALYFDPQLDDDIHPLGDYSSRPKAQPKHDLLIFHLSIGEPDVTNFVLERPERLVLIYHNISPSEPFRPYDPGFAELLEEGRLAIEQLRDRSTLALAESQFNAGELTARGYRNVEVLPLVVDTKGLKATPPDAAMAERLRSQVTGPVILSVGQLLPHKRPDFLIETFHILSTYLLPEANLILVGPERLPAYAAALQTQVDELHLDQVWITGSVSRPALAALFRRADVFVTASEHEGFCVPLLEAMSFGLPFVARRFAAIPETAGDAGLILDPDDGPAVAAEVLALLLQDRDLAQTLSAKGGKRIRDFDTARISLAWRDAIMSMR
jgi:glycosyltransferase involved in cell wall biosynthesis